MKKIFYSLLFCPGLLFAQEVDQAAIAKIRKEGMENSKVKEIAHQLTDVSGPRLTNSPGFQRAAEWSVSELKKWGLQNSRIEDWGEFGKGWQVEKSYLAMTKPYYMPFIAIPKAWTSGTKGPITGEVVVVNIQNEEDLKKYADGKLTGKIVLVKGNADTDPSFKPDAVRYTTEDLDKMTNSQPFGQSNFTPEQAERMRTMRSFRSRVDSTMKAQNISLELAGRSGKHGTFFTSNGASYKGDAPLAGPAFEMAPEHAGLVARLIESGIPVTLEAESKTSFFDKKLTTGNVIAEIPGADPKLKDEVVMLGGHLDSWHSATGATDNAAGCTVMLEAVRILQASGLKPKRTIRIALWSGEEQGLHGSRAYVKNTFGDPQSIKLLPAHEKLSAYYNIDNGTGRIRGIYLQGNEGPRAIFEKWLAPFSDIIDHPTVTSRNTGGTDHQSFDALGLPGFQFIQDGIEYGSRTHHTNMDTYERLVMDDLKQMAVVVAAFVYNTAQLDQKIPRKDLPKAKTAAGVGR
ncbi:M20/M25/M40 family metallo-hydrolase [Dyadobacter chenhuakuii]|uniref:Carboxypeptidase Q n=1 Tax=Dyadobacter chenhuakuii TaxID=2909339 RepID=A0ABY4XFY6_9BACT|nr:M20/M25/M40 family metallo-hydrolase [Dyadobacter chenhuakuii]MCF2495284.1 M20/M25/M40 family metallo-hydrolase [Dyadobacter chenhuakuii]USJ29324.1 M20/M25/M40 family metallo-hydrolase [Dyadobacter chenhuakuii]